MRIAVRRIKKIQRISMMSLPSFTLPVSAKEATGPGSRIQVAEIRNLKFEYKIKRIKHKGVGSLLAYFGSDTVFQSRTQDRIETGCHCQLASAVHFRRVLTVYYLLSHFLCDLQSTFCHHLSFLIPHSAFFIQSRVANSCPGNPSRDLLSSLSDNKLISNLSYFFVENNKLKKPGQKNPQTWKNRDLVPKKI